MGFMEENQLKTKYFSRILEIKKRKIFKEIIAENFKSEGRFKYLDVARSKVSIKLNSDKTTSGYKIELSKSKD